MLRARIASAVALLAAWVVSAGCSGSDDGHDIEVQFEGSGVAEVRIENDEGQVVFAKGDSTATMQGQFAADSFVEITVIPDPGTRFVGFGGSCTGGSNPLQFELNSPRSCTILLTQD